MNEGLASRRFENCARALIDYQQETFESVRWETSAEVGVSVAERQAIRAMEHN
jgi:hypothetical protein